MKKTLFTLFAGMAVTVAAQQKQVWDFGAEQQDATLYENMLSEREINSWYDASITPGSTGIPLPSFTASEGVNLRYNTNGASNHRLRSTNSNLTRYDDKSLKDAEGNIYTGYIYSNSGKQPLVYIEQTFSAGDIVEYYVGSNGLAENYILQSPSGKEETLLYSAAAKIEKLTFYIGETGVHRFYGLDEKLVVARIVRTPVQTGTLSGKITAPADMPTGYSILLSNTANGTVYTIPVSNNTYKAEGLPIGYTYEITLKDANGYIVSSNNRITFTQDGQQADIEIAAVTLCTVCGKLEGLPTEQLSLLQFDFEKPETALFIPQITWKTNDGVTTYTLTVERDIAYRLLPLNVNDYELTNTTLTVSTDLNDYTLTFQQKPLYTVSIIPTYLTTEDLQAATFTFRNINEEGYVYTFAGLNDIRLRDGVYDISSSNLPAHTRQMLTSNLTVAGTDVRKTIDFESTLPAESILYAAQLTVGIDKEYKTLNEALAAVRRMNRGAGERVTILIEPGNYEEMLLINMDNITLKNASSTPSIALRNAGVDIDADAVRITGYYGWGYDYYSMGKEWFRDERTLQVNKENGYLSTPNNQQGKAYWNSTVVVTGKNFVAEDIIFENSFNQYVSAKEAEDILVENSGGKGIRPKEVGSTAVQARSYRERACAIAFAQTADRAWLTNCRVISRQDAIYGDSGCRVAMQGGILNGACDYIFGGMTLVCNETELGMLVTDDSNDVAYITASKSNAGDRGYLFYRCHITSAQPLIDMAESQPSKPGYFGRPWDANAETVFFETTVDASANGTSLITAKGWHNGLVAAGAVRSYEYGTIEKANIDNSNNRETWATVLSNPVLPDGTYISLYNFTKGTDEWDPFNAKDTHIKTVQNDLPVDITYNNGYVSIGSLNQDTVLHLYSTDGKLLQTTTVPAQQTTVIALEKGCYILQLTQQRQIHTTKIML